MQLRLLLLAFFLTSRVLLAQDSSLVLTFDFNDKVLREKNNKVDIKAVGVGLTTDRFGNEQSAVHLFGHNSSYLNLGTSPLLKPRRATVSLWVNLDRVVYAGKGYENNPLIYTKNSPREDFYAAYALSYELYNKRFCICTSQDSVKESIIHSTDSVQFNKWYHIVFTSDDNTLSLFVNGILQQSVRKSFQTVYYPKDSVVVGHSASKKNERYAQGIFDDIQIFHRILSESEIRDLYEAENPDKTKLLLLNILKLGGILILSLAISFLLIAGRRKNLKKREESLAVQAKMNEMEMKVIKAQMNPHFIFNSLNSIQQFIINNENEKASYYLTKFSKLIRRLLESNIKDNIGLKDELEILKTYLEIESLRFNKAFEYEIEVDEKIDASKVSLPHMMVQPFVENAIWHGLLPKDGNRKLSLKFEMISNSSLLCIIEDNGVGRSTAKKENMAQGSSLATSFIQQRLALLSKLRKAEYSLTFEDKTNHENHPAGTKVILNLPIN